jgi:uncharacterized protein
LTLYCESNAIVSVYLREPGRNELFQAEISREPVVSSRLAFVEVRAALARAAFRENPARLTGSDYSRVLREFESDWRRYLRIAASDELVVLAADLARIYLLRAYDAVHLATALTIRDRVTDSTLVSTWDAELARAAQAEGLILAHEVN